jgi:O-antigen/teichoic acid export membrane protein
MLIRNSATYLGAKILPGLLGIATTALLTHLLDPTRYGVYAAALVIMTLVANSAFDWLGVSFMRLFESRHDKPRALATFFQIFALLVIATAILALAAWSTGYISNSDFPVLLAGMLLAWCYAWYEMVSRIEIASIRPLRYLGMNFARSALMLIAAGSVAFLFRNPVAVALSTACAMIAASFFGSIRIDLAPRNFDRRLAAEILRFGIPIAIGMTLYSAAGNGIRAMVGSLGSPEELGHYTAAFLLVQNALGLLGAAITSATYPLAVRAVETGDAETARRQLKANATMLIAVLAPASLGLALTAQVFAPIVVGPDFASDVALLTPWLCAAGFFGSLRNYYFDHAFQLAKRPVKQIQVTAVSAVIGITLGFTLIPGNPALGGAMASAITMVISAAYSWWTARRVYPMPLPWKAIACIAFACVPMSACVLALSGRGILALAAQIAAGAIVYGVSAIALNVLNLRRLAVELAAGWLSRRSIIGAP